MKPASSFGRSVPLWHPYQDKRGIHHIPLSLDQVPVTSLEAAYNMLCSPPPVYAFCQNIFLLPYTEEALEKKAVPFVTKSGNIIALQLRQKRRSGYFINCDGWKSDKPDEEFMEAVDHVYRHFHLMAVTPSSLSEKILRCTLPERVYISKTSRLLREDILSNRVGSRIDTVESLGISTHYFPIVYEYDLNKAYLFHSQMVPSPYKAPFMRLSPSLESILNEYPTGYFHVTMTRCHTAIPPIILKNILLHTETFTAWLWRDEIEDAVDAGYQFHECDRGWSFPEMSHILREWSLKMWESYEKLTARKERAIIKAMMVGLPGRFLRAAEVYSLIPLSEMLPGDVAITLPWKSRSDQIASDYAVRASYSEDAASLTAIGDYIVMRARQDLYHMMRAEMYAGNRVLRSYVDCYTTELPTMINRLGTAPGTLKERRYTDVTLRENRLIGTLENGELDVKAPGFGKSSKKRIDLMRAHRKETKANIKIKGEIAPK
jgi:hypothetical protein